MDEFERIREERLQKQKELKEKRAEQKRRRQKEDNKKTKFKSQQLISETEELLREQKIQTELLKQLIGLLQDKNMVRHAEIKEVSDSNEIEMLITRYIKGELPHDTLPPNKTHRTYRDDEFVERLQHEWNILINKANARATRKKMVQDGELVPIGYLRYVLPKFINEHEQKFSQKDASIIQWLKKHSQFSSSEFKKEFYPNSPRGVVSAKIHSLMSKGWIARVRRAHYETTKAIPDPQLND
ncbi:MAG: hypothetical protein ACTSRW_11020 [Candidatus Helarchaeota archaeon]